MSGPFGKPLFGKPPVAPIGSVSFGSVSNANNASDASSQPRRFNFKQSALSSVADNMWNKSKEEFHNDQKATPIHLEKKSLNDVLGKMTAEKEKNETKDTGMFVFGSKIKEKLAGDIPIECTVKDTSTDTTSGENGAAKSSLSTDQAVDASKFREESLHVIEALKKEQEKQLASTSVVDVTTGEEDDLNLVHTACKVHAYDKEKKSWVERGLSDIRINKRTESHGKIHYRIVVRSKGNQRVVINSKIFPDMFLERVDSKRIKISAMAPDSNAPQVFLLTLSFSKTDLTADALFKTLTECLAKERSEPRKRKASADASTSHDEVKKDRCDEKPSESTTDGDDDASPGVDEETSDSGNEEGSTSTGDNREPQESSNGTKDTVEQTDDAKDAVEQAEETKAD